VIDPSIDFRKMKKVTLTIPENTDLNELVKRIKADNDAVVLNEETLQFPQWIYDQLPSPFNQLAGCFDKGRKKDLAFLTVLTIMSAVNKRLWIYYGHKEMQCNLYTYIIGNPAQGKGLVSVFKATGDKVHENLYQEYRKAYAQWKEKHDEWNENKNGDEPDEPCPKGLFIPADNSKSGLAIQLHNNNGAGLIFETEADTLLTANKSDFGGFSDILRRGFQNENYSVNRLYLKGKTIEIKQLSFGLFITSTLSQLFKMIPTAEDGLFSRYIYYILPSDTGYESQLNKSGSENLDETIAEISEYFHQVNEEGLESKITFSFTNDQEKLIDEYFASVDNKMEENGYQLLRSNLFRMALIFSRICAHLTYTRHFNNKTNADLKCNDIDFRITFAIVDKLIHHLQVLDFLYNTKGPNRGKLAMIPKTTEGGDVESKWKRKLAAVDLLKGGMSERKVSECLFGNEKHSGTIHKWANSYKNGKLLPLPEAEAGSLKSNVIEVKKILAETEVSVFENCMKREPAINTYSLYDAITTLAFRNDVTDLRSQKDEEKRKEKKKELYAFTPSGIFKNERKKESLVKHTKFICIDIDEKDNKHILNFDKLNEELSKIVNIAYAGHSVSGKGWYVLIPIADPQLHEAYFDALFKAFESLEIVIDKSCRDVSRLRYISYDKDFYMPDSAVELNEAFYIMPNITELPLGKTDKLTDMFFNLLTQIIENQIDITNIYDDWITIGFALANKFGENGREYYHKISSFFPRYAGEETDSKFNSFLKGAKREKRYGMKRIFLIAMDYGLSDSTWTFRQSA